MDVERSPTHGADRDRHAAPGEPPLRLRSRSSAPAAAGARGVAPARDDGGSTRLSVVAPFFNEGANVDRFLARLMPVLERLDIEAEVICVNDGSADDTLDRLVAAHRRHPGVKILDLSRNFGQEFAMTAGLTHAAGDAVVLIDGDLQHPPEMIPQMVEKWAEGFEVVSMIRQSRERPGVISRGLRHVFYLAFHSLTKVRLSPDLADFRLLDRHVVDVVAQMPERTRFMKGIFNWVGFRQTELAYVEAPRDSGRSKWSAFRQLQYAAHGISAFSNLPLRLSGLVGAAISLAAFCYAVIRLVRAQIYGDAWPGVESIMIVVLFLGGLQLLTLGVVGVYIGRIFDEVKGRPLYVVRRAYGFDDAAGLPAAEAASEMPAAPPQASARRARQWS